MNTLVLGSSGFIGAHIMTELAREAPARSFRGIFGHEIDLVEPSAVEAVAALTNQESSLVICSGIKRQLGDTFDIFERNIQMAQNLCAILLKSKPRRAIYLSSAAVYGERNHNIAITETTPVDPQTLYGLAKFTAERMLLRAAYDAGAELVILRPTLVYGKGDRSNGYGPAAFHESIIRERAVSLWGDGNELREFLYVGDLARMAVELLSHSFCGVLNPASGVSRSFRECAAILNDRLGGGATISERPRSQQRVDHRYDAATLKRVLPEFRHLPLEEGLREMVTECLNEK